MFVIYRFLINLILILSPFIIIFRLIKKKEDKKRFKEKFCFFSKKRGYGKLIWFHGASVGEILSIIPIIEKLEKNKSINKILITSSTLSSSKILNKFKFKKTIHQFYPIDSVFLVQKFLNYWNPSLAIFIESEIWPCMFENLENKNIPLILLNSRLTKKSFKRWNLLGDFSKSIFNKIKIAYPQNFDTRFFLKKLNTNQIKYIGNLKFVDNYQDKENLITNKLKFQLRNKKIWVASSTHFNEEIFCAKTHLELRKKIKNILTIIIPRHVHRTQEIVKNIESLGLKVSIHSSKTKSLKNTDIYIVDSFGETNKFHKIGCSVFLGGSIISRGGQNPLEAARLGAKIFHGPNVDNFKDVYKLLKSLKISKKINTAKELSSLISFKRDKNSAKKIKKIGRKILSKTIIELENLINNEFKKT
ncbi:glycosyltransferase N-terminal domain-containing protein [Candidatus Pelagibacter sp.]|nr:glycosyltransferase N-terminal domain-containing protein [Candidatus Pelagibacter sp.]